tara:strand:+ start:2987 stop:3676 length:690 start_codon:yes stop_codon:yes gene_type:complete
MLYIITFHTSFPNVKQNVVDYYMPAKSAIKAPRTYHHGDLRDALIDAALKLVETDGPEAVNFNALAKTLGVSQAAPYRHFADREALLTAVATKAFQTTSANFRRKLKRKSTRSKLAQLAHAYLNFGLNEFGIYRLLYMSRLLRHADTNSDLYRAADAGFDLVLETIDTALDDMTRRRIALRFWTSLHGAVMLAEQGILPARIHQISVNELVDELIADTERAITTAAKGH